MVTLRIKYTRILNTVGAEFQAHIANWKTHPSECLMQAYQHEKFGQARSYLVSMHSSEAIPVAMLVNQSV